MNRISLRSVVSSLTALTLLALTALAAQAQTFADQVVGSSGLGSNGLYNNPAATLGQPSTLINGIFDVPRGTYHVSMAYAPYATDPGGNNVITSLGSSGVVTVKFSTPIVHSDQHWYGDDLIVFGNSFFPTNAGVTPTSDMSKVLINGTGGIYQNGTPIVSVSADGIHFYNLTATTWYPTNPYAWAGISTANPSGWNDSQLMDFTKPINPALSPSSFAGLSVANTANLLYGGSAGGAAFSLLGLTDADGNPITSIQYVRFTGDGTGGTNNIDAVSRVGFAPVAATPEPSAWMCFAVGFGSLLILRRKRAGKEHDLGKLSMGREAHEGTVSEVQEAIYLQE